VEVLVGQSMERPMQNQRLEYDPMANGKADAFKVG
jgi:hypothetical protein